jgi:hypothetical protein
MGGLSHWYFSVSTTDKTETTDPDEEVDVVEGDSEEVQLDNEQPEQTTS